MFRLLIPPARPVRSRVGRVQRAINVARGVVQPRGAGLTAPPLLAGLPRVGVRAPRRRARGLSAAAAARAPVPALEAVVAVHGAPVLVEEVLQEVVVPLAPVGDVVEGDRPASGGGK